MFCDKCGKELKDNAQFCSGCGANISVEPPPVQPEYVQPVNTYYPQIKKESMFKKFFKLIAARKKSMIAVAIILGILAGVGIGVGNVIKDMMYQARTERFEKNVKKLEIERGSDTTIEAILNSFEHHHNKEYSDGDIYVNIDYQRASDLKDEYDEYDKTKDYYSIIVTYDLNYYNDDENDKRNIAYEFLFSMDKEGNITEEHSNYPSGEEDDWNTDSDSLTDLCELWFEMGLDSETIDDY